MTGREDTAGRALRSLLLEETNAMPVDTHHATVHHGAALPTPASVGESLSLSPFRRCRRGRHHGRGLA
jgi:hypothetical protein